MQRLPDRVLHAVVPAVPIALQAPVASRHCALVKQLPLAIGPWSVRKVGVFSAFDIDAPFWQRGPIGHVGLHEAGLVHVVVEVHVIGGRHHEAFAHEPGGIIPEAGVLGTLRQQNFKVFGLAFDEMHKMI